MALAMSQPPRALYNPFSFASPQCLLSPPPVPTSIPRPIDIQSSDDKLPGKGDGRMPDRTPSHSRKVPAFASQLHYLTVHLPAVRVGLTFHRSIRSLHLIQVSLSRRSISSRQRRRRNRDHDGNGT
jgi:hypothetical protein